MKQPPGYVYRLHISLYGLKQAQGLGLTGLLLSSCILVLQLPWLIPHYLYFTLIRP